MTASILSTSTAPRSGDFVFATCGLESNEWLKRAKRLHPDLRLAFSCPGFVSWKGERLGADFELRSPIAATSGWGVAS